MNMKYICPGRFYLPCLMFLVICGTPVKAQPSGDSDSSLQTVTVVIDAFSGCPSPAFVIEDSSGVTAIQRQFNTLLSNPIDSSEWQSAGLRCNEGLGNRGLVLYGIGEQPPIWSSFLASARICGKLLAYETSTGTIYLYDSLKSLENLVIKLGVERDLNSDPDAPCGSRSFVELAESMFGWQQPQPAVWTLLNTYAAEEQRCRISDFAETSFLPEISEHKIFAAAGTCGMLFSYFKESSLPVSQPAEWIHLGGALENKSVISVTAHRDTVIAGTQEHGIFRSYDGGGSWSLFLEGLPRDQFTLDYEPVIQFKKSGRYIYALTEKSGAYSSEFSGLKWNYIGPELNENHYTAMTVKADTIITADFYSKLKISRNMGADWDSLRSIQTPDTLFHRGGIYISDLIWSGDALFALIPIDCMVCSNPGMIRGHVLRSDDFGNSWTAIGPPIMNMPHLTMAVDGSNLFLGVNESFGSSILRQWLSGAYYSQNNGSTWHSLNYGLTSDIQIIKSYPPYLYAVMDSGDVYVMDLRDLYGTSSEVSKGRDIAIPVGTIRPVYAGTDIKFDLPTVLNDPIRVSLLNIRGESVRINFDTDKAAGQIFIDTESLRPGFYFARIEAGTSMMQTPVIIAR